MSTAAMELLTAVRGLPREERMDLARTVLDEAHQEMTNAPLSDAMKAELDRRIADADAAPDDVIRWEVIRAEAEARSRAMNPS